MKTTLTYCVLHTAYLLFLLTVLKNLSLMCSFRHLFAIH